MEDHDASANPLYDVDDVDASFGVDQQQQLVHNAAATFDSSWGLSPLGSSFSMLGPDQAYPAQTQTPQAQYGPTLSQSLSGFAFGGYNAPVGFATPDTLYGAPTTGYEQNPQFAGHGVDVTGLAGFGHAPPPQPTETISPYALINGGARPGQADLGQASQSLPVQHVAPTGETQRTNTMAVATSSAPAVAGTMPPQGPLSVLGERAELAPPSRSALLKFELRERKTSRALLIRCISFYARKFGHTSSGATTSHPAPTAQGPRASKGFKSLKPQKPVSSSRPSGPRRPSEAESTSSENDSYTDDSSEEDEDDTEPMAPLPPVRPADPAGQMGYDMIQVLWRPPQKLLSRDEIASAVADFSALIKSAKDRWDAIEKDEATKSASADVIKARFATERTLIAAAVSAAIGFGHVTILSQLGAHQLFLLLLVKVLRDRIKDEDFTSELVHGILDLISRVNAAQTTLEQLKFPRIVARLRKRGDQRTRELVDKIEKPGMAGAKPPPEGKADGGEAEEGRGVPAPAAPKGFKRPNENDGGRSQPHKRQAPAFGTTSGAGASVGGRTPTAPPQPARPVSLPRASLAGGATGAASAKSRAAPGPQRPTSSLAGMAGTAKARPSPAPAPTQARPPPPPSRPVFSVFEALNSLTKSKDDEVKAESATKVLNETDEERRKRLRKEERRKLRVKFKPDDALVEVRYIERLVDDETGRGRTNLRDAGDATQEGRMFKEHRDVSLGDDEEIDAGVVAVDLNGPYQAPPLIDFDGVDASARERNFISRGGSNVADTEEMRRQDERESETPKAIYDELSSIPPSPAEPADSDDDEFSPEIIFGIPPRWVMDRDPMVVAERKRIQGRRAAAAAVAAATMPARAPPVVPVRDVATLLKMMAEQAAVPHQRARLMQNLARIQPVPPTWPNAPPKPDTTELERVFARYSAANGFPALPYVPASTPTRATSAIERAFARYATADSYLGPSIVAARAAPVQVPAHAPVQAPFQMPFQMPVQAITQAPVQAPPPPTTPTPDMQQYQAAARALQTALQAAGQYPMQAPFQVPMPASSPPVPSYSSAPTAQSQNLLAQFAQMQQIQLAAQQQAAYLQQQQQQQPSYQQPSYQQPSYQQPAYQQPAYQQPSYQQPSYQQPPYQQQPQQPQQQPLPTRAAYYGLEESGRRGQTRGYEGSSSSNNNDGYRRGSRGGDHRDSNRRGYQGSRHRH